MSFGAREYLLFALPALGAGLLLTWWLLWRVDAQARFGRAASMRPATVIVPVLLVVAALIAAFAAARPQRGDRTTTVERKGIDLVIVLDVSQSMLATDAQPTRLAQAQGEVAALLDQLKGDRAGLVIFAGSPFVRSPLTSDLPTLRTLVLGVGEERGLVTAGSDLGAAVRAATRQLATDQTSSRTMLIVSDGEDHGGGVETAIREAASAGIRVYTAGAGTESGAAVLDATPDGELVPRVGPDGQPVLTRRDGDALRAMSVAGGGRYIELGQGDMPELARELEALEQTTFEKKQTSTPIERFQIVAALALAVVIIATLAGTRFTRETVVRARRLLPLAGAGLLIGAICSADAGTWNRRGNRQYTAQEYAQAVESYEHAEKMSPQERALYYNRANAYAQLGEYASAIDEAKRALPTDDKNLEALVEYALGHHLTNAEQLKEALEAYKQSLRANPSDQDAKHNYEIVANDLTPSPSPTPTPGTPAPLTPPTDSNNGGNDTPESAPGTPGTGTPQSGGTPSANGQPLSPEELQRQLEEALSGIDQDFSVEEALQVLDLLEQQNREPLQAPRGGPVGPADY